ncbi:MAG: glycosyltransferase [Chloroflexi bacterium]|nr:glycosyltransferase [Chloroflexota bacterium]
MKILALSTWPPLPPDNGARIRAYYLLRALGQAHAVTLLSFGPIPDPQDVAAAQMALPESVQWRCISDSAFRHVDKPQALKFASPIPLAFWPSRQMSRQVAEVVKRQTWDAVVAIQAPVAKYALQADGAPGILDVDTALGYQLRERCTDHGSAAGRLRNWVSWQKARQYERLLFRRFAVCTLVSQIEVPYLRQTLGQSHCQAAVIPNGVDCQRNRLVLADKVHGRLVYNGSLTYDANFDAMEFFLAEVYPLIKTEEPTVSLVVTGSTAGVNLSALRTDASVTFCGHVSDVRIPVSEAELCVAPLRKGGGTRLKILEAMALGTPVVATAKAAEGLELHPGRDIAIADGPQAFAESVVALLRDDGRRYRQTLHARSTVQAFYDWSTIGQTFVDLVESVGSRQ